MSRAKRHLEGEVERLCTCGGGCSLAQEDHEADCEALHYLKEVLK